MLEKRTRNPSSTAGTTMHGTAQAHKMSRDPRREETAAIKAALYLKGLTLLEIDRRFMLPRGTAGNTLKKPHIAGEKAIAEALGTKPQALWRTRYHVSGLRKRPQPRENYVPAASLSQRQNDDGISS
jgi:Ner family transcriptional regulator